MIQLESSKRFWKKVKKTQHCWYWEAHITKNGYGQFGHNNKVVYAHRFSYEESKGRIPKGLEIDHLCRNRACVNPKHLEAVTRRVNTIRGNLHNKRKFSLPVGVYSNPTERYTARRSFGECRGITLGTYSTPEEASVAYETAVLAEGL